MTPKSPKKGTISQSERHSPRTSQGKQVTDNNCQSNDATQDCPEGYYCPADTNQDNIRECPSGTFNDELGRWNAEKKDYRY